MAVAPIAQAPILGRRRRIRKSGGEEESPCCEQQNRLQHVQGQAVFDARVVAVKGAGCAFGPRASMWHPIHSWAWPSATELRGVAADLPLRATTQQLHKVIPWPAFDLCPKLNSNRS